MRRHSGCAAHVDRRILRNDDLLLAAPVLAVTGSGAVDLGAQRLDYRPKPTLVTGGGEGVTVPLLITGRWAAPKITLDPAGLAEEKLAEEAAKLEALARERAADLDAAARTRAADLDTAARTRAAEIEAGARARLEDALGLVQGAGETLEDAARRRAREALEQEGAGAGAGSGAGAGAGRRGRWSGCWAAGMCRRGCAGTGGSGAAGPVAGGFTPPDPRGIFGQRGCDVLVWC